jgi:hypothetical protein
MLQNIRPITNIWHMAVSIEKINLYKEKNSFLGGQLQVAVDGHNLWNIHAKNKDNVNVNLTFSRKYSLEMKRY